MSEFKLKKRDIAIASYTEGSGLAEIFKELSDEQGVATVRITRFGSNVIFQALQTYIGKLLDLLEEDDFETEAV